MQDFQGKAGSKGGRGYRWELSVLCFAFNWNKERGSGHRDLGVVDTGGFGEPTVTLLRHRKGQRQLASLSRSREEEKWLCWGDLCCWLNQRMHGAVSMARWARGPLTGAKRSQQEEAGGTIECTGWRKEYGSSKRDSPLATYLQGKIAVMSTGLQRTQQSTHKTESREHLDTPGADKSCRREKVWTSSRQTSWL